METIRPSDEEILAHLEARLGRRFTDPKLALQALTHSSAKDKDSPCNERLEFLGDAILGHVISEHLYHHFPGYEEGDLSTMKSIIVSASTLADKAEELELEKVVILGRGLKEKRALPRSILANSFEALIAAIYIDGGLDPARQFLVREFAAGIEEAREPDYFGRDHKSRLQERLQAMGRPLPSYRVAGEIGPDHRKLFHVEVVVGDDVIAQGMGKTKKEAEQEGARVALQTLGKKKITNNE